MSKQQRWFFVTNTENLEIYLRSGMFFDSLGFTNNSYIHDASVDYPHGYLPLFHIKNLTDAINAACVEDKNLKPCLIEIDFSQISDKVFFRCKDYYKNNFKSHPKDTFLEIYPDAYELAIEAPFPISMITAIFTSESMSQKRVNSLLLRFLGLNTNVKSKIEKKLFIQKKEQPSLKGYNTDFSNDGLIELIPRKTDYLKRRALGGGLFTSYYETKNGKGSTKFFLDFIDDSDKKTNQDIQILKKYVNNHTTGKDDLSKLYYHIFKGTCALNDSGELKYALLNILNDTSDYPKYTHLCNSLKTSLEKYNDRTNPAPPEEIITKLRIFYSNSTMPEFSNIALLITMLFIRDNVEGILKYFHPEFTEEDYFLIGLFAGIINGSSKIPDEIIATENLTTWVSYKMSKNNNIDTKNWKEPSQPLLIHDKFFKAKTSNHKQISFYKKFCKNQNIDINKIARWSINPKGKVTIENGRIFFQEEPELTTELNLNSLTKAIIENTNKKDFFNFNQVYNDFRHKE